MYYDVQVIERYAVKLYAKAASRAVGGAVLGFLGGLVAARMLEVAGEGAFGLGVIGYLVIATIGGVVGGAIGSHLAFKLKATAQLALCQAEQEKHLRALVTAAHAQVVVPTAAPANANAA